ncbi:Proteasome subunit beta [uncultured archaeon]|nr:Proteasome subunit beta [uncultured archaeon]
MTEEFKPLKGTTTVGLTFKDGVVIAADKRATMGTYIAARNVEKVHLVGDKMALTIAGGVGDAQSLVRMLRAELELYKYSKGGNLSVEGAATLLANVLQGNKYYPYFVQLILAGYDSKPRLFDLDLVGGMNAQDFTATGSGSPVAIGILEEHFKKDLPKDEAVKLAASAVDYAMKRDSATGEGIDVIVITNDVVKRYSSSEVYALLKAN